ncbi:TylF/MycF family methyltransferase [Luminiphilus sp.]|nr:TylF/MycF family methyltransferase [Luminiphilus sp.]MDC0573955.1 TylF/MycF family methyltransferase [Luminiphilus sp.]
MEDSSLNERTLYLDLLEKVLLDTIYGSHVAKSQHWNAERAGHAATESEVNQGQYWPERAHTMIGRLRLRNFREAIEISLREDIQGDILEAGVWRGGASIYARGVLKAHGIHSKKVFVADSFEGLPKPDAKYPADDGDAHWNVDFLQVPIAEVRRNFKAYDLLDEQVVFVEGFFADSLPMAPIDSLCVLRLDGDMYSSTLQVLDNLYHKVSPGGFVIVDDYHALANCRAAIDDFRTTHGIAAALHPVDWTGVYWRTAG